VVEPETPERRSRPRCLSSTSACRSAPNRAIRIDRAPAALAAIRRAVADVNSGAASAIVTNQSPERAPRSGFASGHTEFLGKLAEDRPAWPPGR
jgi:4-hydroxy-L-threonine phosphate dehydrogenase PdxA